MKTDYSLLIKPVSSDCNLRCPYCFYLEKYKIYPGTKVHRMSDEILEKVISGYLATEQPVYVFGWQGGEPTLAGYDFFKKVVELQKKSAKKGSIIANGIQTNATIITEELAGLFGEYKFLTGVSLDGPKNIHDFYRKTEKGSGTFEKVINGIKILRKNNVEFNILTLVSNANVKKGKEVYRFLKDSGFYFHQYIPCVEFNSKGSPFSYSISGEEWGRFLLDIFNEWVHGDRGTVSVRIFDSVLDYLVNKKYNICHMADNCCQYFVVEFNGDIYPCDFFVEESLKLGNVTDSSWKDIQKADKYLNFGGKKSNLNEKCKACGYLEFCRGDCLKHRVNNNSVLCEGWKMFFKDALPEFKRIAGRIIQEKGENHGY